MGSLSVVKVMHCQNCGGAFHFALNQTRVKCAHCGEVQNADTKAIRLDSADFIDLVARQCGDKRRFDSETADKVRVDMETQHQEEYDAYLCPHCGYWHVGHRRDTKRVQKPAVRLTMQQRDDVRLDPEQAWDLMDKLKVEMREHQDHLKAKMPGHRRNELKRKLEHAQARHENLKKRFGKRAEAEPIEEVQSIFAEMKMSDLMDMYFDLGHELQARLGACAKVAANGGEDDTRSL